MTKKRIAGIIIAAVLISWLFNISLGRSLAAKISTWPLLNRWKILNPQAPIVINNRETIRVSDSGDVLQATNLVKSKISALVSMNKNGDIVTVTTALNLTSDGSFVTGAGSFLPDATSDFVVLNDGRQAQVTQKVTDPATSLVFFKAALDSVPTASLGSSKDISPGDKVIFVQGSLNQFSTKILPVYVNFSQSETQGQSFLSDYPRRSFGAAAGSALVSGQVVANSSGEIVGIWNGSAIISSDVLKQAQALYFNNQQKISRPEFGFSYQIVTQNESKLSGLPEGAYVKTVEPASSSRLAGLLAGDVITTLAGQAIKENSPLEEILQRYKPGDKIPLVIIRKDQSINLTLTAGELK